MLCQVLKPCGVEVGKRTSDKAVIGSQKQTLGPLLTDPSALDAGGIRSMAWWLLCYCSRVGTRGVLPQLAGPFSSKPQNLASRDEQLIGRGYRC